MTARGARPLVRWLRLLAYVTALSAIGAWWLLERASAAVGERSLQVGRELEQFKALMAGTTTMELNGERMTLTSASTEHTVGVVLDRFGAACARQSGGVTEELEQLVASGKRLPDGVRPDTSLIVRTQRGEREGVSACFARDGKGGLAELFARLEKVVETGDFGALGQLRYVFVRREEGASSTHVISVSADGPLRLESMFPAAGDAPGSDLFAGARPALSQRILSAKVEGTKHHATIYETTRAPDQALSDFDTALAAHGYRPGDLSVMEKLSAYPARVYVKPDDLVLLLADPEARDGRWSVLAFRLLNGGYVMMQP